MTEKQQELVCRIKISLLKAIINFDDQKLWNCIEKVLKEEADGGGEDETCD